MRDAGVGGRPRRLLQPQRGKKGEAAARRRINCFMILLAGDDFPQLLLDRRLLRARFRLKLLVVLLPEHFLSIRF